MPPREYRAQLVGAPSPAELLASFREQPRRVRRWILWSLGVTVLAAASTPFVAPPTVHHVKGWQARRLAAQAMELDRKQLWRQAGKKVDSAFHLRSSEPEVWRAYAQLLTRTGQGAMALQWWQKLAHTSTLTIEDERDFASSALNSSELSVAAEEVAHLLNQPGGPAPRDLLLASQLATVRGYTASALEFANKVLADARSTSSDRLGANLVVLSNSTPELQRYQESAFRIIEIARNEADPASPKALTVLGRQINGNRLTESDADSTLAITTPDVATNSMSLTEIADRLERNLNSRPYHRMLAMELRAKAQPSREGELVARALDLYGTGDDETLVALGAWLYTRNRFAEMLRILPLTRAEGRRDLLMERIDALAALRRYAELKELLLHEYAVLEPTFQHMYLAQVRLALGEASATTNEWLRALDSAESPRTLLGLADYAEKKGALEIADKAYEALVRRQPELKSAYLSRLRIAQLRCETSQAHDLALDVLRLWPEDDATRMREAYLHLLLTQSPGEAKLAEDQAAPYLAKNPWDGVARSAVALAQLKQGRSAAALTTLTEFTSQVPASAISLPVHAAALAANGWKDKAREEALQLSSQPILPEERALITPILTPTPSVKPITKTNNQ